MIIVGTVSGSRTAEAQDPSVPQQLTAIRNQLTAIEASLAAVPDPQGALAAIQASLAAMTTSIGGLQQSLATLDPTAPRPVTLASAFAFGAAGTFAVFRM